MLTLKEGKRELYQWDTEIKAKVNVPCDEVHFANVLFGESIIVLVKDNEVDIPNILLTKTEPFYCWAFVNENNGGYTVAQKKFAISPRPKPSDYVYTETEVKSIEGVVNNAIQKAVASGDFKGDKGDKGDRGLQGEKGEQGDPYTLTETDKSEIVSAVLSALPNASGVSF